MVTLDGFHSRKKSWGISFTVKVGEGRNARTTSFHHMTPARLRAIAAFLVELAEVEGYLEKKVR